MKVTDIDPSIFSALAELPGNIEWFTEDGSGPIDAQATPGSVFLGVLDENTAGAVAMQPINSSAGHVHVVFHPNHRKKTVLAAKELLKQLRIIVGDMTLFSFIPADNEAALSLIKLLGWREVGRLTRAHMRHMARHDMIIFEAN